MKPPRERQEKDHGSHTLRVWRGTIVGTNGDDVFVELGPRMQGVISRRALGCEPRVGDEHEFTLRGQEEGLWVLARRAAKPLDTWESMEPGSLVHARLVRTAPGGLEAKIGPLHAFLPKSHTGLARDQSMDLLVGKTVTVEVLEVDRERQRAVVSRKLVAQRERDSEHLREVGALKPGDVVQGRVTRIEDYGVFVAFGHGLTGLVHVSNLAHERIEHPRDVVREGQVLPLKVLQIKDGGRKIALGRKQMDASPWADLEKIHYVDQIVEATVTRLFDFGAFVALRPGVEGLLPRSEMGLAPDQPVRAAVALGARVSVRIRDLDCERERLSVSLLHKSGARIGAEEAQARLSFDEIVRARPENGLLFNLKDQLSRALRESGAPPASAG
ncbi:MAG: S1 RNA-binding domain-containing protein [Planctomycetota bacterium]